MRKKISIGIDMARPQRNDAATKSAVVARKRRTWPKRWVSHPVSGTEIAFATAKEVMTQVPWFGDTPRSPAMAGIDTLAIDVSSTFMNVASPTASDAASRAPPSRGCVSPRSASCACAMRRSGHRRQGRSERAVRGDDLLDARVGLRIDRGEGLGLVRGRLAFGALQAAGRAVVRVDVDLHRQADLQRMRFELLRVEGNAHRHALHDLDPVAARVLRRQQREGAAGAGTEAGDTAAELDRAAVGIGFQRHRLPGT